MGRYARGFFNRTNMNSNRPVPIKKTRAVSPGLENFLCSWDALA